MKGRLGHATCVAVKVGEFTSTKVRTTMMLNPDTWALGYENQAVGLPFDVGASAVFLGKLSDNGIHQGHSDQQFIHFRYRQRRLPRKDWWQVADMAPTLLCSERGHYSILQKT